jgi:signal transduction histidine kinase
LSLSKPCFQTLFYLIQHTYTPEESLMSEPKNSPLLNALENERRYMAKELHDGIAQTTLQLGLQIGICRKFLERNNLEMLHSELLQLEGRIQQASGQVREIIQDLRPPVLETDEVSLDAYLCAVINNHHKRGGPPVSYHFNVSDDLGLSDEETLTLGRIVQEGLLNIRKHARANNVRLSVFEEEDQLYLTITDDGYGFNAAVEKSPLDQSGAGLRGLKMRTEAMGGNLTMGRDTIGQGTKITVTLPL